MDSLLAAYFDAWNEHDPVRRKELLMRSLSAEVELIDPLGRWSGVAEIGERIGRYQEAAPGTRVVPSSGVDEHHGVERYSWAVVDVNGKELLEGLDVAERAADRRLRRIFMFHGLLPASTPIDARR